MLANSIPSRVSLKQLRMVNQVVFHNFPQQYFRLLAVSMELLQEQILALTLPVPLTLGFYLLTQPAL
jgi:hypothetical protein